jgi:hypothetical protein
VLRPGPDPDNYPPIDPDESVPDDPGTFSPDTPETLPPAPVEPMPGPDDPDSIPVYGRIFACQSRLRSADEPMFSGRAAAI